MTLRNRRTLHPPHARPNSKHAEQTTARLLWSGDAPPGSHPHPLSREFLAGLGGERHPVGYSPRLRRLEVGGPQCHLKSAKSYQTAREFLSFRAKLYLAVIMDLFSRMIVGWALSAINDRHLVIRALDMALLRRGPEAGLLDHTDQGSPYASEDYMNVLAGGESNAV